MKGEEMSNFRMSIEKRMVELMISEIDNDLSGLKSLIDDVFYENDKMCKLECDDICDDIVWMMVEIKMLIRGEKC